MTVMTIDTQAFDGRMTYLAEVGGFQYKPGSLTFSYDPEVAELEMTLVALDTAYELGEPCLNPFTDEEVSDPDYDTKVKHKLQTVSPSSTYLKGVTASLLDAKVKKVKHNPPMSSMGRAIGDLAVRETTLMQWVGTVVGELYGGKGPKDPGDIISQAWKIDGLACSIYYKDGKLVSAGLRPRDGITGEDVTKNIVYVEGVKKKLPVPLTGAIRGEILCLKSVFEEVNAALKERGEKTFANTRNYAAGSIRQFSDPTVTKDRRLCFLAYQILWDDCPEKDEIARAKWCNTVLGVPHVQVRPFRRADLDAMEKQAPDLDYDVDGVVLSVRNEEDREQMGRVGNSPNGNVRGRLAWKFTEAEYEVVPKSIEWNTGRTSKIVPVLQFDPVHIKGAMVKQCTGHSLGFLRRMKIGIGTRVMIVRSGDIIPKIVGVAGNPQETPFPRNCPSCGARTVEEPGAEEGMLELTCPNDNCPCKAVARLCHYLTTFGVKGLAEATVQKLYDAKHVTTAADFYDLEPDELRKLDLGDRNSLLIVARIHGVDQPEKIKDDADLEEAVKIVREKKKQVPLWKLFAALGIKGAGRSAGRALMSHFGSFDKIRGAGIAALTEVADVGVTTAGAIYTYFRDNERQVDRLLHHVEVEAERTGSLTGQTFCFTGGFPEGKAYWEGEVEKRGGKVASSVSKKVTTVVVGTDAGSKAEKAKALQIPTVDLDGLKRML